MIRVQQSTERIVVGGLLLLIFCLSNFVLNFLIHLALLSELIFVGITNVPLMQRGALYLLLSFGISFISSYSIKYVLGLAFFIDTASLLAGQYLAPRISQLRLSPVLSPNKTLVGCMGGALAAMCYVDILPNTWTVMQILALWSYLWPVGPFICVLMYKSHALYWIACTGDLLISKYKRRLKIKNSSSLLPGHGGVWDRFDSFLALNIGLGVSSIFGDWVLGLCAILGLYWIYQTGQ